MWHRTLPRQISIFLWKLFLLRLPLDEGLWEKRVQLASISACCPSGNVESFNHVFMLAAQLRLYGQLSTVLKVFL